MAQDQGTGLGNGRRTPPPKKPAPTTRSDHNHQEPAPAPAQHNAPDFGLHPDPAAAGVTQRGLSLSELEQRTKKGYSKTQDYRTLRNAGMDTGVVDQSPARLMLQSIGYTGNGVTDFNSAVETINNAFIDVHGYPPSPGLVLDMLRTPLAHDRRGLMTALGAAPNTPAPRAAAHLAINARDAFAPDQTQQSEGFLQGVGAALKYGLVTGSSGLMAKILDNKTITSEASGLVTSIANGDPGVLAATLHISPLTGGAVSAAGRLSHYLQLAHLQPAALSNDAQANVALILNNQPPSSGRDSIQLQADISRALKSVSDIQNKIKSTFHVDLPANGIWTDDWQKLALYMQSNKRWTAVTQVQMAQNALGWSGFDPFKSVDANGKITNSKAQDAVDRLRNGLKAQQGAAKDHWWSPFVPHVIESLPVGFYGNDGHSIPGWVPLIGNMQPGGAARTFLGGDYKDPAGIAENAVRNSGVLLFSGISGAWTQAKGDLWAATIAGDPHYLGHPNEIYKEAVRRMAVANPTWIKIAGGLGTDFAAQLDRGGFLDSILPAHPHDVQVQAEHFANTHKGIDDVTNILGDFAVGTLLMGPEATALDTASYGRMLTEMGSEAGTKAILRRNPFIKERVGQAYGLLKKGDVRSSTMAAKKLDSLSAEQFLFTKRWYLNEDGHAVQWDPKHTIGPDHQPGLEPPAKLQSLATMVRLGKVQEDDFGQLAVHAHVNRGQLFDTLRSPNTPAYNSQLFHRMQRWNKGRLPVHTVHPIKWTRGLVGRQIQQGLYTADRWFSEGRLAGDTAVGGLLRSVGNAERGLSRQFQIGANPRTQPIERMNPENIYRLGLAAGKTKREAAGLQKLFQVGRANENYSQINTVARRLEQGFKDKGHEARGQHVADLFSTMLDRGHVNEHLTQQIASDPAHAFSPGGAIYNTQWATLSAERGAYSAEENAVRTAELQHDLQDMGFHPVPARGVYGGEEEHSFFVPGMTPQEAIDIGRKYEQESVLMPRGLYYTGGEDAGKLLQTGGFEQGTHLATGDRTEMDLGGKTVHFSWSPAGGWEAPKVQIENHHLNSLPMGDVIPMTSARVRDRLLAGAETDEEKAAVNEMFGAQAEGETEGEGGPIAVAHAPGEHEPNLVTQMQDTFSVPTAMAPRTINSTSTFLVAMNRVANRLGLIGREGILASDPELFYKHGITDGLRAMYGQWHTGLAKGGPVADVIKNSRAVSELRDYLVANPEDMPKFDQTHNFLKMGEQRYNLEGRRINTESMPDWTANHFKDKEFMRSAADYVDRLISDGSYRAYRQSGERGVYDFYRSDPKAIRLAGDLSRTPESLAAQTITQIEEANMVAPGFLDDAIDLKTQLAGKGKFRDELAKYMTKREVNIHVGGMRRVPGDVGMLDWYDEVTGKLINAYLKPNKFYRGKLFTNVTARTFSDLKASGMAEKDAFDAALNVGSVATRYHMLDLADALQVEQTLRWGAMFFTKHRLYWRWLYQTMKQNPQLAATAHDIQQSMQHLAGKQGNAPDGTIVFNLAGVPMVLPVARLFWLSSSSANPGFFSNLIHSAINGEPIVPGRGSVEFTTLDSSLNMVALWARMKLEDNGGAKDVLSKLNAMDGAKFRRTYDQLQVSYMAEHHGRPMPDRVAAISALQHMFFTSAWKATAFTGVYPLDPKMSTEHQQQWATYNAMIDPSQREKFRQAHAWIDTQLGMYSSSPAQWTLGQQMWAKFQVISDEHDRRKADLMKEYQTTGQVTDLFGGQWTAEGKRYSAQIDQLKAFAKQAGATDWLTQFNADPVINAHAAYASMLHQLYPGITDDQVKKIEAKIDPPEVRTAKQELSGLSDQFINQLPESDRQPFFEARAALVRIVSAFEKTPSNKVDALRRNYFSQVYDTYYTHYQHFLNEASSAPDWEKPVVYEQMREWMDGQDKPVTVNGVQMPSPIQAHWAMLPANAKMAYIDAQGVKQWGYLTQFQKGLLGVKVDKATQSGWADFNQAVQQVVINMKQQHPDQSVTVDEKQKLAIATVIGHDNPGFYSDYVRGLYPLYARLEATKLGGTPSAQDTWHQFLTQQIQPIADAIGGPITDKPDALIDRASKFNKTLFVNIMEYGTHPGDVGWAAPPDAQHPDGGALYQRAMQYPDPQFRREFAAQVQANPNFLKLLFSTGG